MKTLTPEEKAKKLALRFDRRREALLREMREEVQKLRKIIRGEKGKKK
jgi:hypothetical protein